MTPAFIAVIVLRSAPTVGETMPRVSPPLMASGRLKSVLTVGHDPVLRNTTGIVFEFNPMGLEPLKFSNLPPSPVLPPRRRAYVYREDQYEENSNSGRLGSDYVVGIPDAGGTLRTYVEWQSDQPVAFGFDFLKADKTDVIVVVYKETSPDKWTEEGRTSKKKSLTEDNKTHYKPVKYKE